MNGTVEMFIPGGDALMVLYKCPFCCRGEMKIKMELRSSKKQFIDAMLQDGAMIMSCGNCKRDFTLVADQGLKNMLSLL